MATTRERSKLDLNNVYYTRPIRNYLNLKQIATRPNSLSILMKPSRMGNKLYYPKEI